MEKLDANSDLHSIIQSSNEIPVVFFKHSTRCSRSLFALERIAQDYDISAKEASFYFLDLLTYRQVSDEISAICQVQHQSPQIIIVKKGKVVDQFSHENIAFERIKRHFI